MNLLAAMSWEEVAEYLKCDDRVILPLGSIEEHGRHLGLGTDWFEADAIAQGIGKATGVAVAPAVTYGMALAQMGFPGTLSLRPATLTAVLEDLFRGFYRHGFRRILLVNGHGGNKASLANAVQQTAYDLSALQIKLFEWWLDAEAYQVVREMTGERDGSHAAASETSFMLAVRPDAVKMERLTGRDAPIRPSREITTLQSFASQYPDGIMGLHPKTASREAGVALLNKCVEICVRELADWPASPSQ
jgi:creatinine amidohydrolase